MSIFLRMRPFLLPPQTDVSVDGAQWVVGQSKLAGKERPFMLFIVKHLLELSPEETSIFKLWKG